MQCFAFAGNLFARGMDDFIFATTSLVLAKDFLEQMHQGFPDYDCRIQSSKTSTNFQSDFQKKPLLHFCGAVLNPKTLSCRPDLETYQGHNLVYASNLGMKFSQTISDFIKGKILFVATLNMKKLYLDSDLNGEENVLKNVFNTSYFTALKLHSLLASFYLAPKKPLPPNPYLKLLILKVSAKIERFYVKVNNAKPDSLLIGKVVRFAFFHALKCKYGSFYQNCKLPLVKKSDLPCKMLVKSLKDCATNKIKSYAFQKIV